MKIHDPVAIGIKPCYLLQGSRSSKGAMALNLSRAAEATQCSPAAARNASLPSGRHGAGGRQVAESPVKVLLHGKATRRSTHSTPSSLERQSPQDISFGVMNNDDAGREYTVLAMNQTQH